MVSNHCTAENGAVGADEDAIANADVLAVVGIGQTDAAPVRIRHIDRDKGGDVAIAADGQLRTLGVHLGETADIGARPDLRLAIDPDQGVIGIVPVMDRLQEKLLERVLVHGRPTVLSGRPPGRRAVPAGPAGNRENSAGSPCPPPPGAG